MTSKYFIQGNQPNDWWLVTDNIEHRIIDDIYKINKNKCYSDDGKPEPISSCYTLNVNNKNIEYIVTMEFIRLDDTEWEQGSYYNISLFRTRKSHPNNKRKIEIVYLPNHNGTEHLH